MINPYFIAIVTIIFAQYLFKLVIEVVNLINLSDKPPPLFENDYPLDKYKASQDYLKQSTLLELADSTFLTAVLLGMILTGGFNSFDNFARSFGYGEITTGLIFLASLYLFFEVLHLPFEVFDTFVIEEKFGFNRTTPFTFVTDIIKQTLLTFVIGGIAMAGLLWFFQATGPFAWLYCWLAFIVYQGMLTYIAPAWIMPLFNKFTPLAEGDLKHAIEKYAKEQNFAMKGIFTMDGSKRSSKSNAFFAGFGKNRRVVLFDTLIAKHSKEELISILAHEIGHYRKRHIIKMFLMSVVNTGIMLYLLSRFINNPLLFQAFGMEHLSIYASFVFFSFLYSPIQTFLGIFFNVLSRKYEYEADRYAVTTYQEPGAMISALKRLALDNFSNLTPHPWKVAVSYTHPTVVQRIEEISKQETKK